MSTNTLRPNAAGDETSCYAGGTSPAATNWQSVNEASPDDLTTLVSPGGQPAYARDLYNLPASSGSGVINSITVYYRCQTAVNQGAQKAKVAIKSGTIVTEGAEQTLTVNWTTYSKQWTTNPVDSVAWEWPDIDVLQIGVSLKDEASNGWSRCTQIYVDVDYTPRTKTTWKRMGDDTQLSSSSKGKDHIRWLEKMKRQRR